MAPEPTTPQHKKSDRRAYQRAYYVANKQTERAKNKPPRVIKSAEEKRAYQRAYYEANKTALRAAQKRYKETLSPDAVRAYQKAYRETHKKPAKPKLEPAAPHKPARVRVSMSPEEKRARRKARYEANKVAILTNNKRYRDALDPAVKRARWEKRYAEDGQKLRDYQKRYRTEINPEKIASDKVKYREANAEYVAAYQKAYREKNADKLKLARKVYYQSNKEKIHAKMKERYRTDPLFKLKHSLRNLIKLYFKKKGCVKNKRTEAILGVTLNEAKAHIEAHFLPGMTWDNHGDWHIDHYIPMASATTDAEVHRLNHISNLRPLWAADNIRKGKKLPTGKSKKPSTNSSDGKTWKETEVSAL